MKIYSVLVFCLFFFENPTKIEALLKCVECTSSIFQPLSHQLPCFKLDPTKTPVKEDCVFCSVEVKKPKIDEYTIERKCIKRPPIDHTEIVSPKCHIDQNITTCFCNGSDNCNNVEVKGPSFLVDCYECDEMVRDGTVMNITCFKFNQTETPPIQHDCFKCETRVYEGSMIRQIYRECSKYGEEIPSGNVCKNITTPNKSAECYCEGNSLCNGLEVDYRIDRDGNIEYKNTTIKPGKNGAKSKSVNFVVFGVIGLSSILKVFNLLKF